MPETCDIISEFCGIRLDPCGRPATHTSTGRCEHGHVRTRPICSLHAAAFAATPSAVVCEQCDCDGRDTPMSLTITAPESMED